MLFANFPSIGVHLYFLLSNRIELVKKFTNFLFVWINVKINKMIFKSKDKTFNFFKVTLKYVYKHIFHSPKKS